MKTPRWVGSTAKRPWVIIVPRGLLLDYVAPVGYTVTTPHIEEATGRHRTKLAVAAAVDETWRPSATAVFAPVALIAQAQWFIHVRWARTAGISNLEKVKPAIVCPANLVIYAINKT